MHLGSSFKCAKKWQIDIHMPLCVVFRISDKYAVNISQSSCQYLNGTIAYSLSDWVAMVTWSEELATLSPTSGSERETPLEEHQCYTTDASSSPWNFRVSSGNTWSGDKEEMATFHLWLDGCSKEMHLFNIVSKFKLLLLLIYSTKWDRLENEVN